MPVKLPDDKNPYFGRTPFDILGVSPSATSRELLEARDEKLEEVDYQHADQGERILARQRITQAYDQLSDARSRVGVEMFVFDNTLGRQEAVREAEKHLADPPDVTGVLQNAEDVFPNSPSVGHAARQGREIVLERSIRLELEEHPFPVDPAEEALKSIKFEC
jgi:DnaJ-class molecular chaperone